jgi:hypothetical protein
MEDYHNYPQNNNQGFYNSSAPEQKSNKKIWLLILIPVFVILIGVVLFLFMNSSSKTISDNEFSQGTSLQLKENKEAKFIIDDEEHTIKINSVSDDSVNLIIQSDPIQTDIKIGETKKFDLDNEGFYDIQVKLNGIKDGVPEIYVKKIHESTCTENWNCENWNSCSEQGSQTRTCIDLSSCGTTKNKPATTQSCTYIEPQDISECINNDDCTQTCTNCDDGTYVCAYSSNPLINQKCVECVTKFGCVDGYDCVNNSCVVEEVLSPEETCSSEGKYLVPEGMICNGGSVSFHASNDGSFSCCSVQPVPVSVTGPDTILDCYSEDLSEMLCSAEDALGFTDLFESRLASCEISEGTFALGWEPVMGIFRGYEIQGEQGENCNVRFWFLENSVIDSSLLNKEMVCGYDSSKRTAQGVNDCFEECCSGELVDAILAIQQ